VDHVGLNKRKRWTNSSVVNCGGHKAFDCKRCPPESVSDSAKEAWCNGDCIWNKVEKECKKKKPEEKEKKHFVPYIFTSNIKKKVKENLRKVFKELEARTCLRFVNRTIETEYIYYKQNSGCNTNSLGRNGGGVHVSPCVSLRSAAHETIHALGFPHEQDRADRDNFIEVVKENLTPGGKHVYDKRPYFFQKTPYDYCSIMQYSTNGFSKNRKPTLRQLHKESGKCILLPWSQPVDATPTNVAPYGMSDLDIQDINDYYECDVSCVYECDCEDRNKSCAGWARRGECQKSPRYMLVHCALSCNHCDNTTTTYNHNL